MTGPTPAVDLAAGPAVPDRDDAWAEAHTRALDDPAALRKAVFDRALEAANALPPAAHNGFTLTLAGADYVDPDHVPLAAQKEALLSGRTLGRRLKGTWVLTGPDGQELHRRSQIVARVPYVTDRGTVVHNGSDYGTKHQTRLRPGVYVRPTADGKYEAQVNAAPGDGVGHRYRLDPATSVFRVAVGQSEVPLLPLARALGATDDELQAAWGEKVWAANRQAGTPADLKKLFDRLVPKRDQQALAGDPAAALRQALSKIRLDPLVARRTLPGGEHPTLSKDALLAATKRVLAVARGEDEGDDRDHLAYQSVHGLEDLIAERLKNDHSYYRRDLVREAAKSGRLDHVPSGALTRQIEQVLLGSGLGASLEESSPAELLDKLTAVTRMGEGGIHSTGTIPVDARSVHPSQLGYVDILRTPESDAAGVDLYFAAGARKGHDGQAYTRLLDAKTGKPSWQSPADIADKVVAFPEALKPRKLPAWAQEEARRIAGKPHPTDEEKEVLEFVRTFDPTPARVPALVKGKLEYVAPREVDYVLPHFEPAFSPLGQFVPGRSAAKGQRASMAARMLAQALPLVKPEAPLVRTQLPDGRSPEEAHAGKFGAVRAAQDGTVEAVTPDGVTVRHADGTVKTHEIANHFPYNRKTALHQTALVKPGDPVKAGQLLATSNFTDETGHAALGANLRVAYLPWHGPDDYEDAVIVSESAARRLTSSHAYKVGLPGGPAQPITADKHKALFPGRYTAEQLAAIGDDGAVKVGTRVSQGDPLVLAAAERPLGGSKTLKRNQPAFADHTQTWDYADPGVVTDVVPGPDGPTVLVTAERQARVGDKLCYDEKTEVLTASGWKPVSAVTLLDEVYTLAPDGRIELVQPAATHVYPHSGRMYSLETTQASLCVTENHALYASVRTGGNAKGYARGEGHRLVPAADLAGRRYRLKRDGVWVGQSPVTVTLPAIIVPAGQGGRGTREMPAKEIPVATYAMILGAFLAEGNTFDGGDSGCGFDITQIKQPNRQLLLDTLDALGVAYSEHGNEEKVRVYGRQWYEHFKPLGYCYEKYIPPEVFSWGIEDLRTLYRWMMWGDGSVTGEAYHTTSPRLADDVQRLALLLGYSANIKYHPPTRGKIKGKEYDFRARYWVSIYRSKNRPEINHGHNKRQSGQTEGWVDYDGLVYCVTLPRNHVLYVRRNGKPVWCGNSGRYGDKGIISRVLPDDQMPQTPAGPAEVLVSPTGVVSRANPAQMIELALGGVARKLGRPVTVPDFDDIDDLSAWARDLARQHGVSTLADVTDPVTGRTVKGVPTGERFFLKLHHQAEDKLQARDGGGYDSEGRPSKGGAGGAKRLSLLDTTALLAHGAYDTLRDGLLVRGGQNDDYWAAFLQGHAPPDPDVPLPYRKFVSQLQASGINVVGDGPRQRLLALTDADVDQMAGDRVVSAAEAVRDVKGELKPVPGGLFDPQATGGFAGSQWAAVKLHEPLPNPTFEQPIKSLLGLTTPKFEKVLSGEEKLPGGQTGPAGIKQALASLDVPRELDRARQEFAAKKGAARDAAARRIGYLKTLARTGQKPEDWVLSKVPVLPPVFRPVSRLPDGTPVVADANYLYLELLEADKNLRELKGRVGDSGVGPERLAAYRAFQALTGLADPQQKELKQKGVRGLLAEVTGDSPKFGCFDDQTEILTADGWRRFDAVEVGTVVATLNPETAAFEWQPAQVVHRYPYDGHLFAFETKRGLDFVVTADHRNWVRNRIGKPDNRGIEEGWGFEPAYVSATHGNRKWYRAAATTWKGHAQRPAFLPEACSLEDFAEFVGWWAAEGWLGDRDKKCVQILQSLKKGYCVERIGRVIDALGLKYGVGDYWRGAETLPDGRPGEKTLCRQWSIRSKELAEWLATHVGQLAEAKRLSSAVRDWDTPYLVAFFRGYLAGDGELWGAQRIETDDPRHKNRAEVKLDHGRSSTTSIELAGNLQEMACKIGYRSTIVPLDPWEGCENCKPAWRVNLSSSRFAVTEGNAFTGLIRYTGVVSCVTVPNGVVYVRRNGRPMFSGNSVQRNLLSATVDNVGRGVLVPDGELDMDSVGLPENLAFGSYGRYVVRRLARQGMPVTRALKEVKDRTDRARQALVEEMGQRPVLVSRAPTWHKFGILALKPRLVAEDVIRLSPLVFKGYGADSDGDQMNVHVPASESAVQEAYDRLLPSRNLFHPANLKSPIHQFGQDYLAGLHQATAPAAADKPVKKYATRREALAAFRRGEVGLNDPVEVAG